MRDGNAMTDTQHSTSGSGNHDELKSTAHPRRPPTCDGHRAHRKVSVACQTDSLHGDAATAICSKHMNVKTSPNDGSKNEGTLKLMIKNFHNMNDTVRGPGVTINHVPWKIMVMPRQHVMQKKGTQKCLGFFLQCCPDSFSDSWTCNASAELRLISQKTGVQNFTRKTTHNYSAKENDWGYSCFMTWADILDEVQGFIKDDKVILEVHVKAEAPKNVLTYDGFAKKIQDYMRLAELQSSRGLIDKAIEVNQSALKFCKEKDDGCKELLDEQNQKLIDLKVQQRIELIEKGHSAGAHDENVDEAGNMLALKQALTGTTVKSTTTTTTVKRKKKAAVVVNGVNAVNDYSEKKSVSPPTLAPEEEASTSGDEGDLLDEEDEPCDGCLQEQLDEMETPPPSNVTMCDGECQTETAAVAPRAMLDALDAGSFDEQLLDDTLLLAAANGAGVPHLATAGQLLSDLEMISHATSNERSLSDDDETAMITDHLSTLRRRISEGTIDSAMLDALNVNAMRDSVKEQHLIDLITNESRSSLDNIRDTLERLVQLTQDGEAQPQLDFDLENLRSLKTHPRGVHLPMGAAGRMDIVELPPDTPPDTDVVDLGSGEQPPVVVPKRTHSASPTTLTTNLRHHDALAHLPFTFSDRDELLVAKAKQIIDLSTDEVVRKYSELTVQSEATRLAESMTKVQNRMKEIERQTTSCRKELADESERHLKEEGRLAKELKTSKHEAVKEKANAERLNVQLRDRKAELKKLEKRVKQQESVADEVLDLKTKTDVLEKEAESVKRELRDATKRMQREQQKVLDQKKQLQQELTSAGGEGERLTQQLDDRQSQLRKAEHRLDQERKTHGTTQRELLDRCRKSEVIVLEQRMSAALRTLNNAAEESVQAARHWEAEAKRYQAAGNKDDVATLQSTAGEWRAVKDKVADSVSAMKKDYAAQIEQIRSGKTVLTSLQPLDMPKPPAQPRPPHLSVLLETSSADTVTTTTASTTSTAAKTLSMAPIGSARPPVTPNAPQTVVTPVSSSTTQPTLVRQTSPSEVPTASSTSRPSSTSHTPVPLHLPATVPPPTQTLSANSSVASAPGVQPTHSYSAQAYTQQGQPSRPPLNSLGYTGAAFACDSPSQQQQPQQQPPQHTQQQQQQAVNGFNPWSDHFSIGDSLMRSTAQTNGQPPTSSNGTAQQGGWDQWSGGQQWQQGWNYGEKGASGHSSPSPHVGGTEAKFGELMSQITAALPTVDPDRVVHMLHQYRNSVGSIQSVQASDVIASLKSIMNPSGGQQQWPSLQTSTPGMVNMEKFSRPPPNMAAGGAPNVPQRGW